jgi:lysine 6-dehydrogenase
MNVIILGGGLIGGPMALDLAKDDDINVSVADISDNTLKKFDKIKNIQAVKQDLSDKRQLSALISNYDIIISAVPGFMGYETLKTIIEAGKNAVDIAFFPEDALTLDTLAKEKNVTAVVDCGVAPGMSNMLTGYAYHLLDKTDAAIIYVGGLPEERIKPWEYKAVFSPIDVLQEYIRPAFLVEDGKVIEKPALSEPELINFPHIGTLEAFNTDGLRSLIKTLDIPDMKEKTMRYPGYIDKILFLRENGFLDQSLMLVNGREIRPIDLTASLLFPQWKLKQGESDLTVMRVQVSGTKDGKNRTYTWDIFDRYDPETQTHSMARTTGYTATSVLRLLKQGLFNKKGIIPPEIIGQEESSVLFVLHELKKRNIEYKLVIE